MGNKKTTEKKFNATESIKNLFTHNIQYKKSRKFYHSRNRARL